MKVAVRASPELVLIQTDKPVYIENDDGKISAILPLSRTDNELIHNSC